MDRDEPMIEAQIITFDCYGTLIDWESGIVGAFQTEAARDAVVLDPTDIVAAYMTAEPQAQVDYRSYREVLTDVAQRVSGLLGWRIGAERAGFLAESLAGWKPFPDTNPALERLSRKFRLGILSNIDDDLLAKTLSHFTVAFDLIVTAQQVKSYKPALAHFKEALVRAGSRKIIHAAQSYFHDVVPARSLNIPVIWVNRKGEEPLPGGPLPDQEVDSMAALADLLGA
jgi:2-haloalkanoic acid dehalogenase type II